MLEVVCFFRRFSKEEIYNLPVSASPPVAEFSARVEALVPSVPRSIWGESLPASLQESRPRPRAAIREGGGACQVRSVMGPMEPT